jgi:hypothetical protein
MYFIYKLLFLGFIIIFREYIYIFVTVKRKLEKKKKNTNPILIGPLGAQRLTLARAPWLLTMAAASSFLSLSRHPLSPLPSLCTDFCGGGAMGPAGSAAVLCYRDTVTQLHIAGAPLLPRNFSIGAMVTTLSRLLDLMVLTLSGKLGRLASLEIVNMSGNYLFGEVPRGVSRLAGLQTLVLDDNMLWRRGAGLDRHPAIAGHPELVEQHVPGRRAEVPGKRPLAAVARARVQQPVREPTGHEPAGQPLGARRRWQLARVGVPQAREEGGHRGPGQEPVHRLPPEPAARAGVQARQTVQYPHAPGAIPGLGSPLLPLLKSRFRYMYTLVG